MIRSALPALLLLTAASSSSELDRALAGRVAQPAVDCIEGRDTSHQVIDDRTLLYSRTNRTIWRNDLPEACRGMSDNSILVIEPFGDRLCAGDRFHALDRGSPIPGTLCRLGKFTPYVKAKR